MSYMYTTRQVTVAQILRFSQNGETTFENMVQRGLVWNIQQKSDLIYSLCMGIPIPPIYAKKVTIKGEDGGDRTVYDVIDGKQRMNTISQFLSGAFKLKNMMPVTYTDAKKKKNTVDLTGKKFEDLPMMLQEILKEQSLQMVVFEDATQEELVNVFILHNNGKPLTTKSKALAHCKDTENILKIGQHQLFFDMLTKKKRENKDEVTIISKMYMMLNDDIKEVDFSGKHLNAVIQDITIDKTNAKKLNAIFDYADDVYQILADKDKKIGKKFLKEVHLVSLVPYIQKAIDKKTKHADFANFIETNFSIPDVSAFSETYDKCASQSVASMVSIQGRDAEIAKKYNKAFK